jgi:carbonyl reductase 1
LGPGGPPVANMYAVGRIAIVTGANQGLGLALAAGLAQQLQPGEVVYFTGRDPVRVRAAVEEIADARAEVRGEVLDVRDTAAVVAFAEQVRARHGRVDIVFSNAAARLAPGTPWEELVGPFVDTNNLGATRMLRAFDPILRPGGRILVVASAFGSLRELPAELRGRFDTDAMTLDDVDATMLAWRDAVLEGRAADEGWPEWINIPSKVGQVAAARVLARERRAADTADGTLVAAVCPGLVDTAASRPWFEDMSTAQTPEQAADALLRLALDPVVDPRFYGELVQFGAVIPWR